MLLAAAATARCAHAEQAHAHVHAKMRVYVQVHTRARSADRAFFVCPSRVCARPRVCKVYAAATLLHVQSHDPHAGNRVCVPAIRARNAVSCRPVIALPYGMNRYIYSRNS